MIPKSLSRLITACSVFMISEVSTLTRRMSTRKSPEKSMKVPRTAYLAPTSLPILAAVCASTRPVEPRFCSSSSFCTCSRSTTRQAVFAESSEMSIPGMPRWRPAKLRLSCPMEPPFSNSKTATPGRASVAPCAASPPSGRLANASRASRERARIEWLLTRSESQVHAFLSRQHFCGLPALPRGTPRRGQQPVHRFVVVLRLVMEQHQPVYARFGGERHRFIHARMSPPPVLVELRRGVHRVVHQKLGAGEKVHQIPPPLRRCLVRPARPQLVVRHVRHTGSAAGRRQPVSQGGAGVAQSHRPHRELPQGEVALGHFAHRELRRQRVQRHREHRRMHLLAEDRLEAHPALLRAPNPHRVARREEGLEVGQALNVIPVRVGEQNLRFHRAVLPLHQLQPQGPDSGPGVENDEVPARSLHGHARCVAAVTCGVGARRGDRPARPPKSHRVGQTFRHADSSAKLLIGRHVRQVGASPGSGDPSHARPAAVSSAPRSRITISLRVTSIRPLSTSSRMVRLTVSRDDPIICAMVWCASRRVTRSPPVSSASSSSSRATRPFTSSSTGEPTFSSTRRSRRESSRRSDTDMAGVWTRICWKSSRRRTPRFEAAIAITCAERGSSSISAISPKNSPGPRTERIASRPSSPMSTTFT